MRSRLLPVALVVLVLLGACGGSSSNGDGADGLSTTTTLDPNDPFTPTDAAVGSEGGTNPGDPAGPGASTTSAAPGSGGSPSTTTAGPAPRTAKADANGAPAAGSYAYKRGTTDVTLKVSVTDRAAGTTRQTHRLGTDDQAEETSLRFGSGPTLLVGLRNIRDGQTGATCDVEPDLTLRPADLRIGAEWSGSGMCTLGTSDGAPQARQTESGEVTGTDTVTVDGQAVQVVIYDHTSIQEVLISGAVVATTKRTTVDRYAPALGLVVSSVGTSEATVTGKPPQSGTYELRLQSLVVS